MYPTAEYPTAESPAADHEALVSGHVAAHDDAIEEHIASELTEVLRDWCDEAQQS